MEAEIAAEARRRGIARSAALIHLARLGMEVRGLMEASAEIRTLAAQIRAMEARIESLQRQMDAMDQGIRWIARRLADGR
jgi:TolA-binding protein